MNQFQKRALKSAELYAKADKSDPFAYNRAVTHVMNGIASALPNGEDAIYSAVEGSEQRGGGSYSVPVYNSMRRP